MFPPPVDSKISKSPFLPLAKTCLSKKVLKSKSFPHAVNAELGPVKTCADRGFLFFFEKVHINSPAKCSISEQEPPLPARRIFFCFFWQLIIF